MRRRLGEKSLRQRANARLRKLARKKRRANAIATGLTYKEYIQSTLWYERRKRFYRKFGRKCVICDTTRKIHLHHMLYTAFDGSEPDSNLVSLCDYHHNLYHATYGTKPNMVHTTMEFVRSFTGHS